MNNITHSFLDFEPIEKSFISKQINKLSSKKAVGHDGISAKILKFAKPVVLQPITYLINETIKVSEYPVECKKQWSAPFIKRTVPKIRRITVLSVSYLFYPNYMKGR